MLLLFVLSCILTSSLCITVYPPISNSVQDSSFNLTQILLNVSNHHDNADEYLAIHLEPGNYTLNQAVTFNTSGLSIIGNGDPTEITVSCQKLNAGFTFKMVHSLSIMNVTLANCGQLIIAENSAINAAIYADECIDVKVSNVVIVSSHGIGFYGTNLHGNCVFERVVMARNIGGGIFLHFQDNYLSEGFTNSTATSVEFNKCTFVSNSVSSIRNVNRNERNLLNGGAGLRVIVSQVSFHVNLRLMSTSFQSNIAEYGAGVLISMTSSTYHPSLCPRGNLSYNIFIEGCSFVSNTAYYGGSALFVHREVAADVGGGFAISDCVFIDNIAASNAPPTLTLNPSKGTTVSIQYTHVSLEGKNNFVSNHGTALEAIGCELSICGKVCMHNNIGTYGGGFRLLGNAYILLHWNSSLYFTNNSAYAGSSVYVGATENDWLSTFDPCFLYFSSRVEGGFDQCEHFINVHTPFIVLDDSKDIAVFGSTLEQCEWARCVYTDTTIYDGLKDLNIIDTGNSTRIAGSLVESVRLYTANNESAMPGQLFEIGIVLFDKFDLVMSGVVSVVVVHGDADLAVDGLWFIKEQITVIQLSLKGVPDQVVTLSVFEVNVGAHAEFTVTLEPCLLGFEFDSASQRCECQENLASFGIFCDVRSASFIVPSAIWMGPFSSDNNVTLVVAHCVEDYCKGGDTNISNDAFNFQCKSDRTGDSCGSCASNHSAVLGSSQCKMCTNYSLFMIVLFLITGLLTVTGIMFLRITITEGYLNAVLFYCNILNVYAVYFTPTEHGKGVFFLAGWISQNFGIPVCFYNGMTTLEATGLHLLYIVYLFVLTILLSLLLCCKQLPQSHKFAPSKVIATLLVICYTSLLETCLEIMSFTIVRTLDGAVFIRWYFDPNVVYFSGLHAVLAVVSIIIILSYLIPFPFLIMYPRLTYKVRFFKKLKPLLDTFWAPFKQPFCWWLSFRLFLRWIPFFVASFASTPNSTTTIIITLAILLFIQSQVKPFRKYWHNVFDEALVLNAILLFNGRWFLRSNAAGLEVYSGVFVGVAYLVFAVIFVFHMLRRFPKFKSFLAKLPAKLKNESNPTRDLLEISDSREADEIERHPPSVISHYEMELSREKENRIATEECLRVDNYY